MKKAGNQKVLVIDVGNTNITFGVFGGKTILATFRKTTKMERTSDEFGISLLSMLRANGIAGEEIDGVMIASVVPQIMHGLVNALVKYIGREPYIVGPGIKTGIKLKTENPKEIGPDLIVDSVAAYELYGGPVLSVDFGTATTYILVDENGALCAGAIAPGIRIAAKALWEDTAKLPEIEIRKPPSILGRDTISTMQAGLVYGQIGQTKYIINEIKRESGYQNLRVVATGGLGRMIAAEVPEIDVYDAALTLKGLKILYEKNRRTKPHIEEYEERNE